MSYSPHDQMVSGDCTPGSPLLVSGNWTLGDKDDGKWAGRCIMVRWKDTWSCCRPWYTSSCPAICPSSLCCSSLLSTFPPDLDLFLILMSFPAFIQQQPTQYNTHLRHLHQRLLLRLYTGAGATRSSRSSDTKDGRRLSGPCSRGVFPDHSTATIRGLHTATLRHIES